MSKICPIACFPGFNQFSQSANTQVFLAFTKKWNLNEWIGTLALLDAP